MICGVDIYKKFFNFCIIDNNLNKLKESKFNLVRDDLDKFIQIVNENVKIINPKTIKRFADCNQI